MLWGQYTLPSLMLMVVYTRNFCAYYYLHYIVRQIIHLTEKVYRVVHYVLIINNRCVKVTNKLVKCNNVHEVDTDTEALFIVPKVDH